MSRRRLFLPAIACAIVASLAAVRLTAADRPAPKSTRSSSATERGAVRELVFAQPFLLDRPYVHAWRRERPQVWAGWLVVLAVDPEYVRPRQIEEPVLCAGDETVERINHGYESGRVVAIVPSALDLARASFFFGEPDLPERVDAAWIAREHARAIARGARPFTPAQIAVARAAAPASLHVARREDLEAQAALLVLEHAPEDHDLATGLLAPAPK